MYLSCSVDILDQINNHGKPMEEYSFWTGQCTEVQLMDRSVHRICLGVQNLNRSDYRVEEYVLCLGQSVGKCFFVRSMYRSWTGKCTGVQLLIELVFRSTDSGQVSVQEYSFCRNK